MDEAVGSNPTEGSNDKFTDLTLFPQGAIAAIQTTRTWITGLSGVGYQGGIRFKSLIHGGAPKFLCGSAIKGDGRFKSVMHGRTHTMR